MTNLPPKTEGMAPFALRLRVEHQWLPMTYPDTEDVTLESLSNAAQHYLIGSSAQEAELLHSDGGPWRLVRSFKIEISVTDHGERLLERRCVCAHSARVHTNGLSHCDLSFCTCAAFEPKGV